jgi:WD40 repeat protein
VITGHTKWVRGISFSPDGARLASGSYDNTAKLWDAGTGAMVQALTAHTNWVTCVAFSPDGAGLATGSWDKNTRLWDIKTGALIQTLTGHTAPVLGVGFSPDGARMATRDRNRVIKVWDVKTGKETADPGAAEWLHKSATMSRSPDGQRFALGHGDGTILLVKPLPPDETELGYLKAMARPHVAWHWEQAQRYEKEKAWFAVRFHCDQVLKSRPDDPAAKALRDSAHNEWKAP